MKKHYTNMNDNDSDSVNLMQDIDIAGFELAMNGGKDSRVNNRNKYQTKQKIEAYLEKRRYKDYTDSFYDDWN